jgi:hypothetical protein
MGDDVCLFDATGCRVKLPERRRMGEASSQSSKTEFTKIGSYYQGAASRVVRNRTPRNDLAARATRL